MLAAGLICQNELWGLAETPGSAGGCSDASLPSSL